MRRLSILALAAVALVAPALAQTPGTARVYGTIESFDGRSLKVNSPERGAVEITLPPALPVGAVAERRLTDIHQGDYVGSAAMKGVDGKLHAQEVHIFTEAQRGVGEGHRPMDRPDRSMTNATVAEVAAPSDGGRLRLKYKDGEQVIEVGPEARVVAFVAGDRTLLKPGATVRVMAEAAADGSLTARSIQAEKDGVKPLM